MNDIPDRVLNGLRARVQQWERENDLDPMEAAIALELVASEREVAASRSRELVADGNGDPTADHAWDHFKRTGCILPGHQDTIAARRAAQIKRGEEVTRVGGAGDE